MDNPTSAGKIIILNGPSSSGKSTLALALQEQIDIPFIRFSFDLFLEQKALPLKRMRDHTFSWESIRPAVFSGIQRCVPALAAAGNNVIFDHIIETQAWLAELVSLLSGLDVYFVGLHCSLPELERREMQRGNRRRGEARADLETVHAITRYDLELNSEDRLEDNVALLIRSWKERKPPCALDRMIDELKASKPGEDASSSRAGA